MAKRRNIHTVSFSGQTFTRTSASRTYAYLVVGKRSFLDALSRAGRIEDTDASNYRYWEKHNPERLSGYSDVKDYQEKRREQRLKAVQAAKDEGFYDRFEALAWCSRKDLAEKQAHAHRKFYIEVTILPVAVETKGS
ncbi:hypothetical protein BSL82_03750 [Tardibacter chloracetimidivorans]|uniref:Uncharacterized protein n=1 Tax=Tardibacter chloracetimidivorans TaxID=1921510 RepID=A0A1L3ZSB8_9SPHN|nr:hypothetical protein [Tardibacter chloracetimidivorans]API58531.1 hypothetical protein BSL82_03750 [Tardibacter chloracetimidivorans]